MAEVGSRVRPGRKTEKTYITCSEVCKSNPGQNMITLITEQLQKQTLDELKCTRFSISLVKDQCFRFFMI